MKKMFLITALSLSLFGNDRANIVSLCLEDGYSKSICECAYDRTSKEVDLETVIQVDSIIDTLDIDSIEYKTAVEFLTDYNTIFEMKLDECTSEKLQSLFK